ncbi:MAG TPA: hypothetical protein VFM55_09440 [Micromonosporaceae bacterium]|nr:hypothetical protein [Micromonosporaceae bacterium]
MSLSRRLLALGVSTAVAVALAAYPAAPAAAAVTLHELAMRWAPIHYQDTDSSDYDADYLSPVNFDGEWQTINNWENQDNSVSRLAGTAYYSVVETSTHWFLVYAFYHPRDWTEFDPFGTETHENDMEGVLLTVRKNNSTYGRIEAMVTAAHNDFYSYVPSGGSYGSGRETVDGTLLMRSYNGYAHPTTRQEAKGHGAYAWNGADFPGGDGVIYYPSGTGEVPAGGNDRSVGYRLVNTFASSGLWSRRYDSSTFASWGTFCGDNGVDNAANAAWGWDDEDDGSDLPRGMLATDPAYLVAVYFSGESPFSLAYTRNAYRS